MAHRHTLVAPALLCVVLACGDGPTGPEAADIVVTPSTVTLAQLETEQLTVSVVDGTGTLLSGVAVTFESADETIATVSKIGLVTSTGPAGSTHLVLRASGLEKEIQVTVTPIATKISVAPDPAVIAQLGTLQLEANLLDLKDAPIPGAVLIFSSGDPAVATVNATGLVTSVGPAGQATIAISSGTIVGLVVVAVTPVPTAIVVAPDPITIGRNSTLQLQARVQDALGTPIAGAPLTFQASPSNLLTVSASGQLTAADGLGTGSVTIRSGGLETIVAVNVIAATHPQQGTIVATTQTGIDVPFGVALSGNGRIAVGGLYGGLARGVLPSFALAATQVGGQITAVAFGPDDRLFASGIPSAGASEIDPAAGTVLRSVDGLEGSPFDLLVSQDGQTLFVGTSAGWVYFIDVATLTVVHQVQVGGAIVHLALHPTQPLLYASPQGSTTIFEINTTTRAQRSLATAATAPQAVAVSLDGSELYVANEGGTVDVITLATGTSGGSIPLGCGGYGMARTPDGAQLYVSCSLNAVVKIVDLATRTVIDTLSTGGTPRRVAVTRDGRTVAVANESGWVDFIQ